MTVSFGQFVASAGRLVVQPRMGFSDPRQMRSGLEHTKFAAATTVGTLTLDSYTRVGDHDSARRAVADGVALNGYPIVTYPVELTRELLAGVADETFPVQVRHGSSRPQRIIRALTAAGLDATEGGPVSYCLPYGRTPLRDSVASWAESCELLARLVEPGRVPHLESFGGCMLGQLCPPSLLVAISVLEGLFFTQHGIDSISLSYAQQTDPTQDEEAIRALRRLGAEFLPVRADWHVVVYTYMGVYPLSAAGARRLLETSAELAVRSGAQRLIVKTVAEAHRIPTIEENVRALETAATVAVMTTVDSARSGPDTGIYAEARTFVEAVLELHPDAGAALLAAFSRGYLDIPYCLHPDNAGLSRSYIDDAGWLRWSAAGRMPIRPAAAPRDSAGMSPARLLSALNHVARKFDHSSQEARCIP
ncbi:methylaspartate mutase [Allorhizocola rhizosphaerae]|uniref:methylaspartate mutase n=1 Tax=Allorhizocola rhizosphaerae TaxID=1872709 RepID=UPI000E3DF429|nr:methylaspartate mutase [Allorhizocola rhizosphaerae]